MVLCPRLLAHLALWCVAFDCKVGVVGTMSDAFIYFFTILSSVVCTVKFFSGVLELVLFIYLFLPLCGAGD